MSQQLHTLSEAAALCPRRVHCSTLWRWARKGCKARNGQRVHLRHLRVGGRVMIPGGALNQFFEELAQADIDGFDAESAAPTPSLPRPPEPGDTEARAAQIAHAKATCFG